MAREESGMSISTPPFFNGMDYGYWKSRMEIFLNPYDSRVRSMIINGYTQPNKPRGEWTFVESDAHKFNFKALNAIASGLALDEFRKIVHLKTAKEAWKLLLVTHEGTSAIKMSKLYIYTAQLEALRMKEDEEISQFNAKLSNLINILRSLSEDIPESKVVWKVLRSLPKRSRPKVTTTEESKDLEVMKLEKLIGSLQMLESVIKEPTKKRALPLRWKSHPNQMKIQIITWPLLPKGPRSSLGEISRMTLRINNWESPIPDIKRKRTSAKNHPFAMNAKVGDILPKIVAIKRTSTSQRVRALWLPHGMMNLKLWNMNLKVVRKLPHKRSRLLWLLKLSWVHYWRPVT